MARVILQPAFVLHTRSFRDTSLLVDLFTLQYGRVSTLARGVRSAKSKSRGLLLPFVPLLASWSGKTELMTLGKIEANGSAYDLLGKNLLSGFYLNELLVRLLARHDPHPDIFHVYQNTLNNLQNIKDVQITLRLFEKQLLAKIGYGLQLTKDVYGSAITADQYYYYEHERGFIKCQRDLNTNTQNIFSGENLLAFHNNKFKDVSALREIKYLMRFIFDYLLDNKPLKSRELVNK
jgi:DNA repair protein RecO (recombination protein O)